MYAEEKHKLPLQKFSLHSGAYIPYYLLLHRFIIFSECFHAKHHQVYSG